MAHWSRHRGRIDGKQRPSRHDPRVFPNGRVAFDCAPSFPCTGIGFLELCSLGLKLASEPPRGRRRRMSQSGHSCQGLGTPQAASLLAGLLFRHSLFPRAANGSECQCQATQRFERARANARGLAQIIRRRFGFTEQFCNQLQSASKAAFAKIVKGETERQDNGTIRWWRCRGDLDGDVFSQADSP